jgi:Ner family transcriptional regulator
MTSIQRTKKQAQDWHAADVQAALKKRGWSYRLLAVAHGYCPSALSMVPRGRQSQPVEKIIAQAIGLRPHRIWPSRYRRERRVRPELWGPKPNRRGSSVALQGTA